MPHLRLAAVLLLGALAGGASGQTWLDEGLAALRIGETEAASERFAAAVVADPEDAQARALLALTEAEGDRAGDRALDRALRLVPDRPELQEVALDRLRRRLGEARALSVADTRRVRLARRLVALDPGSALGHEELALHAFLDYEWRRRNAERRGLWRPDRPSRPVRTALDVRDRVHAHLDAAAEADPAWAGAHRLRMRLAAFDGDAGALAEAADAATRARPDDAWSALYRSLAFARLGAVAEAEVACRLGAEALPEADQNAFLSPARFVRPADRAAFEADSAAWAERFWRTRDSRRLTDANERFAEHCARLVEADLLYGADGVRGWDTPRGDTHVRYGPPDRDVWWLAQADGRYHRWEYGDFAVTFHDWVSDGDYRPASRADGEDDATRLRSHNNTVGEQVAEHVAFPIAVAVTAFRGRDGQTEWVVAYGAEAAVPRAGLRTGVFVVGDDGRVLTERRDEGARLGASPAGWTGAAVVVAERGRLVVEAAAASGAFGRGEVAAPDRSFAGDGLRLSDLLLAYRMDLAGPEAAPPGHVRRGDLVLHPAPDAAFSTAAPLVVYAEAYGLRLDDGTSRVEVEAVLQPVDEAGRLRRLGRRLLGRRPPASVSVASTQEGGAPDDAVALTLDLQNQTPGSYRLTLTLRDLVAGTSASASRPVRLDPP